MSTGDKRPRQSALEDGMMLRSLFGGCYERWIVAGSVRRNKLLVSDVEHVVLPRLVEVAGDGLFGETKTVNALWQRLDSLVSMGEMTRAVYTDKNGNVSQRWGELYRGVLFRGFKHELFTATPENWGAQLLIRTGPAEYSRNVVDVIRVAGMYRQQDGQLIHVASGEVVPVLDEQTYLKLAGMPWQEPEDRT